jgi:hypothetical protein
MVLSSTRWLDFSVIVLIAIVLIIIVSEEFLGIFLQKPIGGILTLATVGILGYIYFKL